MATAAQFWEVTLVGGESGGIVSMCSKKRPSSGCIVAVLKNFRVQVLLTSESLADSAAIVAFGGRIRGVCGVYSGFRMTLEL